MITLVAYSWWMPVLAAVVLVLGFYSGMAVIIWLVNSLNLGRHRQIDPRRHRFS